jgi:predicted PurR-regulated permease PerM
MTGPIVNAERRIWSYWPFLAGALLAPKLANALSVWLPLHYAAVACYAVAWFMAISLFQRRSARNRRAVVGNIVASLVVGVIAGVFALVFPWK